MTPAAQRLVVVVALGLPLLGARGRYGVVTVHRKPGARLIRRSKVTSVAPVSSARAT
jgi:hypothetical protein